MKEYHKGLLRGWIDRLRPVNAQRNRTSHDVFYGGQRRQRRSPRAPERRLGLPRFGHAHLMISRDP